MVPLFQVLMAHCIENFDMDSPLKTAYINNILCPTHSERKNLAREGLRK